MHLNQKNSCTISCTCIKNATISGATSESTIDQEAGQVGTREVVRAGMAALSSGGTIRAGMAALLLRGVAKEPALSCMSGDAATDVEPKMSEPGAGRSRGAVVVVRWAAHIAIRDWIHQGTARSAGETPPPCATGHELLDALLGCCRGRSLASERTLTGRRRMEMSSRLVKEGAGSSRPRSMLRPRSLPRRRFPSPPTCRWGSSAMAAMPPVARRRLVGSKSTLPMASDAPGRAVVSTVAASRNSHSQRGGDSSASLSAGGG
ncbi:hypothetical protein SORBI_3001G242400 [Sorghum bicolor]|uniref:Uncharacterized protein n=1 Tax=Sorghum bicolor TaxID=4558 RepID=A0A1B6QKQ2_SORBI|nr:hypothetical protein SORBI_3001G242400 [Sorghum bicolor]